MIIITDPKQVSSIADPPLRHIIEQRIQGIEECCPWDANELGPIIVIESGDTPDSLAAVMGFSILSGLFDDSRFGDDNFAPGFEFAESHGNADGHAHGDQFFELVYIVSDSGYGFDIFVPNATGIDPVLLTFCRTYATRSAVSV